MNVNAYKGAEKIHLYSVDKDGEPLNFTAKGVIHIEVVEQGVTLSSVDGDITFSDTELGIRWGALALPPGEYQPIVYVYSPERPDGEILFGPGIQPINLTLYEDERPHSATLTATLSALTIRGPSKPIKSIVVDGQLIDFSLYTGDLTSLSELALVLSGGVESEVISPLILTPEVRTFNFKVTGVSGRATKYRKNWFF